MHHFEHSRDDLLQDFCLLADDLFRDYVRQRQSALQPIEEAQQHLVEFVLFLHELSGRGLLLSLVHQL